MWLVCRLLIVVASLVEKHGSSVGRLLWLQCPGLVVGARRVSCSVACGILVTWTLIESASPALQRDS